MVYRVFNRWYDILFCYPIVTFSSRLDFLISFYVVKLHEVRHEPLQGIWLFFFSFNYSLKNWISLSRDSVWDLDEGIKSITTIIICLLFLIDLGLFGDEIFHGYNLLFFTYCNAWLVVWFLWCAEGNINRHIIIR